MSIRSTRHSSFRALAAAMALVVFVQVSATASPGDILSVAAPALSPERSKATPLNAGDASVSTQTGALTYTYPIHVPPGRHGMQPSLGLTYSSQAPIYGTVAAGWALSIPSINVDTSNGRLATAKGISYTSSMAGGRPLVNVTEILPSGYDASYRAQNDTTFTRYLHRPSSSGNPWLAQTADGTNYYFAQADHTTGCTNISEQNAPLTSTMDSFGNAIDYYYENGIFGDCRIAWISWGQNANASLPEFARVTFGYSTARETCNTVPIGSQTSYQTTTKIVTGASKLLTLTMTAFDPGSPASIVHTRLVTLNYSPADADCTATHAAFRSLSSIQESAWITGSPHVDLPAVGFTYGPASTSFAATTSAVPWHSAWGGTGMLSTLSWGQRFNTSQWPTVEAMLVDIDGDGLPDRVTNDFNSVGGFATKCGFSWERNPGNGAAFETVRHVDLPTLKWASPSSTPYAGGSHANENATGELCALNYQQTSYLNSHGNAGTNLGCPGSGACPVVAGAPTYCAGSPSIAPYGNDCGLKNGSSTTILAYRWIDMDDDGKVDLVASIAQGGLGEYNLRWGNGVGGQTGTVPKESPPVFGDNYSPCPTSYSDGSATNNTYTMCNGMYPWFVYRNKGGGIFGESGLPSSILYQPTPLETTTGDSTVAGRVVGSTTGNVDLDGDGHSDEVVSGASTWSVFRGGPAASNNVPVSFKSSLLFTTGTTDTSLNVMSTVVNGVSQPISTVGLFDLNGDGLLDRWSAAANATTATVEMNAGYGFIQNPLVYARRPGTDGLALSTGCLPLTGFKTDCARLDTSRTIDVDDDGRPDLVQLPGTCPNGSSCVASADCGPGYSCANATQVPGVYFNEGGQFNVSPVTAGVANALIHREQASSGSPDVFKYTWAVLSDMIDLDGDGIAEGYEYFSSTQFQVSRRNSSAPPRLLTQIDNGYGAQTQISYAPLSNSAVVTQDSVLGKVSPRTQWVVATLSTMDSVDMPATTMTSSLAYKYPVYNRDDLGHYGLRGFEEATTTGPTGAKMTDRYRYDVDWRGAHTQTLTYGSEGQTAPPTKPTSIDATTWEPRALFADSLVTFYPTVADHYVCGDGQTEATCTATGAAGFTHTTTTFTACAPGVCDSSSVPQSSSTMWVATRTLFQGGTAAADGDRRTSKTFYLYAAAGALDYRARPISSTQEVQTAGAWGLYGKSARTWDAIYLTQLTDETWADSTDTSRSITQYSNDGTTGNVLSRRKPNQTAANGPSLTYDYDSRKLFVARAHTEAAGYYNASETIDYLYEYGTGTKLETKGPNIATCSGPLPYNASTCPANTTYLEDQRIQIDGLGRTIDRWETMANAGGSSYRSIERERDIYVDGTPSSVTKQIAYDYDPTTFAAKFTQTRVELDGSKRATRSTSSSFGTVPADAVTTYSYSNSGLLASVTVPDPTANSTATVKYSYTFDSLGRPLTIRRPDSTTLADRSGADISYSGLTTTTTEVAGSGGGAVSTTTSSVDSFGRLKTVDETVVGTTKATTTYGYDAANHVISVLDPTGIITTMVHDFAGRRIQIKRSGSTWKYGYDRNGNMNSETFPGSTPATIQNYINTITYDDLDRPTGKNIGQRALGAGDIASFGTGYTSSRWDVGANGSGRLGAFYSYPPGGSQPTTSSEYIYDLQGREEYTSEAYVGLSSAHPSFLRHHNLVGGVVDTYYNDYPAQDRATYSNVIYDSRGLPSSVQLSLSTTTPTLSIAQQTRNVAGLVTKRHSDVSGSPMTFSESNWTYDVLGRVVSQVVQDGPGPIQIARQDLAYFGNDDPKTMDEWLGTSNHKRFTYGFDLRHQLTSVSEALLPNAFTAAYTYDAGGRFMSAVETAAALANSDVRPRNVTYQYNGLDREQVTALVSTNSAVAWAYTYDTAGNQTMRCSGAMVSGSCTGADETDYVYDGEDRLRRATRKVSGAVQGIEEYWYDGRGNRNVTVRKDAAGNIIENVWIIGDTESHYDGGGAWIKSYANVSLGTFVARVATGASLIGKVEFQYYGLTGSTFAVVDQSTGTINASFSYAPFGELIEATSAGGASTGLDAHRRRQNDKYVDRLSDLTYFGARYYDKTSMSWTQADPLYRFVPDAATEVSPRRASLYQFTLENPLRYLDPDGLDAQSTAKGAPVGSQCVPSPAGGCSIESSVGSSFQGGTELNQDRDLALALVGAIMGDEDGIIASSSAGAGTRPTKLTGSDASSLKHILAKALTLSKSLRAEVRFLLSGKSGGITTNIVVIHDDESAGNPVSHDEYQVLFNPNDHGEVWSGGLFRAGQSHGGLSSGQKTSSESNIAHEIHHAYRYSTGAWQNFDVREEEIQATKFENTFRRESGEQSRDAYLYEAGRIPAY